MGKFLTKKFNTWNNLRNLLTNPSKEKEWSTGAMKERIQGIKLQEEAATMMDGVANTISTSRGAKATSTTVLV